MSNFPYVIEGEDSKERMYDLVSRMLKDRIIFINTEINTMVANSIVAQLLFLESQNEDDIYIYINSPGGCVRSMLSIYDTMSYIKPDVNTFCYGTACSAASFLLAAGTKGKRCALPNAEIMIHEMSYGMSGSVSDIDEVYLRNKKLYDKLVTYYSQFTGQPAKKIFNDVKKKDYFMSSEEALKYGLIDKIQTSRSEQ